MAISSDTIYLVLCEGMAGEQREVKRDLDGRESSDSNNISIAFSNGIRIITKVYR